MTSSALVGAPDFRVPWLTGKQFPAVSMIVMVRVVVLHGFVVTFFYCDR
jgi:hypothetical protein